MGPPVERPAIPSALESKGETYSTPLPALSEVTVLSIVRASPALAMISSNKNYRLCLASFYLQMSQLHSFCLWSRVRQSKIKTESTHDIGFPGFGEVTDEADIAFWTGILGREFMTCDSVIHPLIELCSGFFFPDTIPYVVATLGRLNHQVRLR